MMASVVSTFHCIDISSLVKYLFKSLARFTKLDNFLIIALGRCLHVWDASLLSGICFVNIFSQAVACFLILLTMSFEEQRFVFLMESNVPHFPLWIMHLMFYLGDLCLIQGHKDLLFCCFMVLCFSFKLPICIELMFLHGTRYRSTFFLSVFVFRIWVSSCSRKVCWKDSVSPTQ